MKNLVVSSFVALILFLAPAYSQDADKGERAFRRCQACHAVGEGAQNKIGPQLNGIVDRAAGSVADFNYSDALMAQAEEGLIWDEDSLNAFLTKPREFMKGTKMAFPGIRKEEDRLDLIAYLATFGDDS